MNINEIRARVMAASPGPWFWRPWFKGEGADLCRENIIDDVELHPYNILKTTSYWPPTAEDAEFIAHARQDVEDLLLLAVNAWDDGAKSGEAYERQCWEWGAGRTFTQVVDELDPDKLPERERNPYRGE